MKYYLRIRATTNEKWRKHNAVSLEEIQNIIKEHLHKNKVMRIVVKEKE